MFVSGGRVQGTGDMYESDFLSTKDDCTQIKCQLAGATLSGTRVKIPALVCHMELYIGRLSMLVVCSQSASRLRLPCGCIARIVTGLVKARGSIVDSLMCTDMLFINVPDLSGNSDR